MSNTTHWSTRGFRKDRGYGVYGCADGGWSSGANLGVPGVGLPILTLVIAAAMLGGATALRSDPPAPVPTASGDVMRGWNVFHDKRCVDCHAIWDQGGLAGPDLGRLRSGRFSDGQLAGVMWNHIPKMLGRMKQSGRPPATVSAEEMADLFALIFFVRQLDEPGSAVRGEEILRIKGCLNCHAAGVSGANIGPDLAKWSEYANPVVWAQLMWEHAPMMEEAMQRSNIEWPKLEGDDLVHIVAYVRSAGASGEKTYLGPGSVTRGKLLFQEKKCNVCHPGAGPDLATSDLPASIGALASRMWNHSPAMTRVMREQEVERPPVTAQELADLLAYVLTLAAQDPKGDPANGKKIFTEKGCAECHRGQELSTAGVGPPAAQLGSKAAPASMAAAMWNHGEGMLERMTEAGIAWPVFDNNEMVDLVAYLRTIEAASPVPHQPSE